MGQPNPKPLGGLPWGLIPLGQKMPATLGTGTLHCHLCLVTRWPMQGQRPVRAFCPLGVPLKASGQDAPPPQLPAQRLYRASHLFLSLRSSTPPPTPVSWPVPEGQAGNLCPEIS